MFPAVISHGLGGVRKFRREHLNNEIQKSDCAKYFIEPVSKVHLSFDKFVGSCEQFTSSVIFLSVLFLKQYIR